MGILTNLANIGRRVDRLRDTMYKLDCDLANSCSKELDKFEKKVLQEAFHNLDGLTEEEVVIGQTQNKIAAIKAYRVRTGAGLADAKQKVEDYFYKHNLNFAYEYTQASS